MADWKEESSAQHRVTYDKVSGSFRILNLWDESVRNLPIDAEIPENSSAMKTLSALEVNALLGKVNEMGWIKKIFGDQVSENSSETSEPRKSIQEIAITNVFEVAKLGGDESVAKEAISAIRDMIKNL
jgi:hypothetical protein